MPMLPPQNPNLLSIFQSALETASISVTESVLALRENFYLVYSGNMILNMNLSSEKFSILIA